VVEANELKVVTLDDPEHDKEDQVLIVNEEVEFFVLLPPYRQGTSGLSPLLPPQHPPHFFWRREDVDDELLQSHPCFQDCHGDFFLLFEIRLDILLGC
jgi:hypothetical protein